MFDKDAIELRIEEALRDKFENYAPETSHMPFHTRLLGGDRMALYSFIHSLNTNFGTTIFEKVASEIATGVFDEVALQREVNGVFAAEAQAEITKIMNELSNADRLPNHADEVEQIRRYCQAGPVVNKKLSKADIYLVNGNCKFLIDLKTAKPNKGNFEKFKQDMLEWAAAVLYEDDEVDVRTIIAIPYNPYEPKPYKRWTIRGMLEVENQSQLMVGQEFWNFLAGGQDIYQDLLDCFENVGLRMRHEIDTHFERFRQRGPRITAEVRPYQISL